MNKENAPKQVEFIVFYEYEYSTGMAEQGVKLKCWEYSNGNLLPYEVLRKGEKKNGNLNHFTMTDYWDLLKYKEEGDVFPELDMELMDQLMEEAYGIPEGYKTIGFTFTVKNDIYNVYSAFEAPENRE